MNYKISANKRRSDMFVQDLFSNENADNLRNQEIDFQSIIQLFEKIQKLYVENQDKAALECINSLDHYMISNNPYSYQFFNSFNIASILLDYLSNKFEFSFNRTAILAIIEYTKSNDERYITKFIHLSICEKMKHLVNAYNYLTPFALLELSYICKYKKSFDLFYQVDLNFNIFFQFLFESHGRNYDAFMKSFTLLASIFDPPHQIQEIIAMLKNIGNFISNAPISELNLYVDLLIFIVKLTNLDNFHDLANQTAIAQVLIDLLYKINNPTEININFLNALLSLLSDFSQDSNCPEIQGSFLINMYFKFQNPTVSSFIVYIIGNLCKYKYESRENLVYSALNINPSFNMINEALKKGFIKELGEKIIDSKSYLKLEALSCFSKMVTYSPQTMRIAIINASGLNLAFLMSLLVDSLFYETDDTSFDRIQAILCIFDDLQKTCTPADISSLLDKANINSIFELNYEIEDENIILEKLKASLVDFYNKSDTNK